MKIPVFLKEHFEKRLEKSACLVIYDAEKRYRAIVQDLEDGGCRWIDASHSTILAREEAMETWRRVADSSGELQSMVIYLPVENGFRSRRVGSGGNSG
jgi:phosphopantothenate synthetase